MEKHLLNKFHLVHQKKSRLCTMGRDNLTNQWTNLVAQHLKSCFGYSEMPEQSLSSKYFCRIVLHECVPKQQKSTPESNDYIYCVSPARSEAQVTHHI